MAFARARLEQPTPRVALGTTLRGIATAAADVSDGLLGDLGHILERSGVGATLDTDRTLTLLASHRGASITDALRHKVLRHVLSGGDDYELVFTAPDAQAAAVQAAALASQTPVTCIGQIDAKPGMRLVDSSGRPVLNDFQSFDHFA
jgi:thiamine-monophosphate kinase